MRLRFFFNYCLAVKFKRKSQLELPKLLKKRVYPRCTYVRRRLNIGITVVKTY